MKTLNLFLSIFLIGTFSLFAQPTITADVVFNVGESSMVNFVDNYFNPGPTGPNSTWDFSSLPPATRSWDWIAEDPAQSVFGDSVPTSNLFVNTTFEADTMENYVFYRMSNDSLSYLGDIIVLENQGDTSYSLLNLDPYHQLAFPINYEDVQTDEFAGANIQKLLGFTFLQVRRGTVTHTADAYGTVTTPLGTFQNALRIKTEEVIKDTAFFMGIPSASEQINIRYAWYAAGEKYLIMQMDSLNMIQPGFTNIVTHAQYRTEEVSVSIDEEAFADQIGLKVLS